MYTKLGIMAVASMMIGVGVLGDNYNGTVDCITLVSPPLQQQACEDARPDWCPSSLYTVAFVSCPTGAPGNILTCVCND